MNGATLIVRFFGLILGRQTQSQPYGRTECPYVETLGTQPTANGNQPQLQVSSPHL
jgi:hypothetical protein